MSARAATGFRPGTDWLRKNLSLRHPSFSSVDRDATGFGMQSVSSVSDLVSPERFQNSTLKRYQVTYGVVLTALSGCFPEARSGGARIHNTRGQKCTCQRELRALGSDLTGSENTRLLTCQRLGCWGRSGIFSIRQKIPQKVLIRTARHIILRVPHTLLRENRDIAGLLSGRGPGHHVTQ
jgi:hypothetical protein